MHFAIDRFEGDYAILENINNATTTNVLKSILPSSVKEGDILLYDGTNYIIDENARKKREDDIMSKREAISEELLDQVAGGNLKYVWSNSQSYGYIWINLPLSKISSIFFILPILTFFSSFCSSINSSDFSK